MGNWLGTFEAWIVVRIETPIGPFKQIVRRSFRSHVVDVFRGSRQGVGPNHCGTRSGGLVSAAYSKVAVRPSYPLTGDSILLLTLGNGILDLRASGG